MTDRTRSKLIHLLLASIWLSGTPAAAIWWTEPGSGTHIIPDPRPPVQSPRPPPPPPAPIPPSPLPPPDSFVEHLKVFIRFSKDIASMRAWFSTLSPEEQERFASEYEQALSNLVVLGELLRDKVFTQLDRGLDSNLYVLHGVVKQFDTFRARGIFLAIVDDVSRRVFSDYLSDPENPTKARRARDLQALRSHIGHPGAIPRIEP